MDKQKLETIKARNTVPKGFETSPLSTFEGTMLADIHELIAALEASQAEVKRLGYENRVIRAAHDVPNGLSIIVPGAEKDEG